MAEPMRDRPGRDRPGRDRPGGDRPGGSGITPIAPGAAIGILGGGQLGRMLCLAAAPLGLRSHVYCPDPDSPAFQVASRDFQADYTDSAALMAFAETVDVVTYEFENVPLSAIDTIASRVPVRPGRRALQISQDRLSEKTFLQEQDVPVCRFAPVDDMNGLKEALALVGTPSILKTRRFGYDGKGQVAIENPADAAPAFSAIGEVPSVLERQVRLMGEYSVIVVAGGAASVRCYDPAENVHRNHILHTSKVPAGLDRPHAARAIELAARIAKCLDYVGVLGVEFFLTQNEPGLTQNGAGSEGAAAPRLLVNEIAPRVHNSGHWTQDGCAFSQFENHIRAIAGWPVLSTDRHADVIMTNLIGDEVEAWPQYAREPGTHVHIYGKSEVRDGRKMGHINRVSPNR